MPSSSLSATGISMQRNPVKMSRFGPKMGTQFRFLLKLRRSWLALVLLNHDLRSNHDDSHHQVNTQDDVTIHVVETGNPLLLEARSAQVIGVLAYCAAWRKKGVLRGSLF